MAEDDIDFDELDAGVSELDLIHRTREELYAIGNLEINPERWARLRDPAVLRFEDLVADLHGTSGLLIRCPFHGRDSKPSFHLYPHSNDAFCFGCPPGAGYYDAVTFTALKLDKTRYEALVWLEENYDLPKIEDYAVIEEEEDDDTGLSEALNFHALVGEFIRKGSREVLASADVELAEDYVCTLFEAWPDRDADPNDEQQLIKVIDMASILGHKVLEQLKKEALAHG